LEKGKNLRQKSKSRKEKGVDSEGETPSQTVVVVDGDKVLKVNGYALRGAYFSWAWNGGEVEKSG